MPTGRCLCGAIKISYTGEPAFRSVCHCADCRRRGGYVFGIPEQNFNLESGTPKRFTGKTDHGTELHTDFCGDCGTTIFTSGGNERVKGLFNIRANILDQVEELKAPLMEIYVERRLPWLSKLDGAMQMNSKYEILDAGNMLIPLMDESES